MSQDGATIGPVFDDSALRRLASQQHGLVAVHQCDEVGVHRKAREHIVDGKRWERPTPRVLRLVGSSTSRAQQAMLAALEAGPGGCLSSTSAAAWWGVPGNVLQPWQVIRRRGHVQRPERVASRHEPVFLPEHHVVMLEGVPVVVPARALFEVAGTRRRGAELTWWVERMARMVDSAWSMRLVSGTTLRAMLDDLAQRGRPGIRVMRQVLAERPGDYIPPASGLESRVMQILRSAGLPSFRRQVDVGDDGAWIGRVDFIGETVPVVLEVQSERFHRSHLDQQLDGLRIERLTAAGYVVTEIFEEDVWHRPHVLVTKVRRSLDRVNHSSLTTPSTNLSTFVPPKRGKCRRVRRSGVSFGWRRRRSRPRTCPRRPRRWPGRGSRPRTAPRSCRSASRAAGAACW